MTEQQIIEAIVKAAGKFAGECIKGHGDGRLEDGPFKLELYVSWEGTKFVNEAGATGELEVALFSATALTTIPEQL